MKAKLLFLSLVMSFVNIICLAQTKPLVYILATGGTIAGSGTTTVSSGYTAGVVSVDKILASVPQILNLADIKGEQIVNIGSQDMNIDVWLKLANRINELLAQKDVTAVIITHGTDTMEETAYFLNLVVKSNKPVIIVGSMRPSTGISADGPDNIYDAVACAVDSTSKNNGVMIIMDDKILSADDALKTNTTSVETFQCPNYGYLGYVYNSKPIYTRDPIKRHTVNSEFSVAGINKLPEVDIIYGYAGAKKGYIDYAVSSGVKGIVYAGVGNGNPNNECMDELGNAVKKGVAVVRSTRVPYGPTTQFDEVDDDKYGFSASWYKTPEKSRILLMLALTKTTDYKEIQRMFLEY